jgi:hypothetical protein
MMVVPDFIGKLIGGAGAEIVSSIGDTVGKFVHTGEEKAGVALLQRELDLKFKQLAMDANNAYLNDRQSARDMYEHDSGSQKILTVIFTVGYFAITAFMFVFLLRMLKVELSDFVIAFISGIFGAFNAIMIQIISFYFGSSQGGENQGRRMANAFSVGAKDVSQENRIASTDSGG